MQPKTLLKMDKEYSALVVIGVRDCFYILARHASPNFVKMNHNIEPFFFNRTHISNEALGLKLYEYLSLFHQDLTWEEFRAESRQEDEFLEKTDRQCSECVQMSLQQFHSKKIGVLLKADKNRFAVLSFQKLIDGKFFGIPRATTTLPNPISAKELGYWVKEGLNRCFLRGNYKIAKSSGISVKYNRRLEIVSPKEFPEGAELILPRNRGNAFSRTALILYLKNGLLGYYENSFSLVVNRDMFDPYAAWGFLPYDCSDKALGERVHRSLLCLDSSLIPKKERLTGEDYIPESQRVERLFLEEMKLRLGLKTDEELFEGLLCCHPIELQRNYLIAPTRRIGFKNFAIMGKRYVVENIYCTASELGASIREAFRRCESAPLKELPTLIDYDENP